MSDKIHQEVRSRIQQDRVAVLYTTPVELVSQRITMSEPQELATLSVINVMASTNKESLKPALLFVPVQPHGGSAAAMSYRTIVKKHIAHQCSRNRHGSKAYIPTAKTGPGEMGKQLVRFKLKQGRRTPQKAKILAASKLSKRFVSLPQPLIACQKRRTAQIQ